MGFFQNRLRLLLAGGLVVLLLVVAILQRPRTDRGRVYRVGVDDLYPYQFFTPEGSADGFAVQTLTEAARRRGLRLQFVPAPNGPDAAFREGTVDLWPRLRDTPERRQRGIHVTAPWLTSTFCVMAKASGQRSEPVQV